MLSYQEHSRLGVVEIMEQLEVRLSHTLKMIQNARLKTKY